MSGSDSSPNFDWLTKGTPKKQPGSAEQVPSPFSCESKTPPEKIDSAAIPDDDHLRSDSDHEAELEGEESSPAEGSSPDSTVPSDDVALDGSTGEPSDVEEQTGHLLEDLDSVPDPIMNDSDGTTLIIRNRQSAAGHRSLDDFPAREEFLTADDASELDRPASDASDLSEFNTDAKAWAVLPNNREPRPHEGDVPQTPEDGDGDATDTFHISDLIPPDQPEPHHAGSGDPEGGGDSPHPSATPDFSIPAEPVPPTAPLPGNFPFPVEAASTSGNNLHSDSRSAPLPEDQEPGTSESAVIEETALPAPPGNGDQGRTEVLCSEDLAKAKQAWGDLPPLTLESADSPAVSDLTPLPDLKPKGGSHPEIETYSSAGPVPSPGPSRMFVILASYASAITIAFLVLLMKQIYENGHPHQLESLPDIATQKQNELTYVPPYSGLPRGHTLHLGETQRFGNIEVTPLEIVQEPVEFTHYSGNSQRLRPPTQPVWKLRLRLTNVSPDQEIAPLDRHLVLRWVSKSGQPVDYTNYFIAEEGIRDHAAPLVQLYRLPVDSDWDMVGQNLGKVLQPGESYETYLAAAEEDMTILPEHLIWRVQIRKGYSPQGHGVTTIFQVAFTKAEIVAEIVPEA